MWLEGKGSALPGPGHLKGRPTTTTERTFCSELQEGATALTEIQKGRWRALQALNMSNLYYCIRTSRRNAQTDLIT